MNGYSLTPILLNFWMLLESNFRLFVRFLLSWNVFKEVTWQIRFGWEKVFSHFHSIEITLILYLMCAREWRNLKEGDIKGTGREKAREGSGIGMKTYLLMVCHWQTAICDSPDAIWSDFCWTKETLKSSAHAIFIWIEFLEISVRIRSLQINGMEKLLS